MYQQIKFQNETQIILIDKQIEIYHYILLKSIKTSSNAGTILFEKPDLREKSET